MTKEQREYLNRVKKNIQYHKNNLWKLPEEARLVEIIDSLESQLKAADEMILVFYNTYCPVYECSNGDEEHPLHESTRQYLTERGLIKKEECSRG